MQTFLPLPSFSESASTLDRLRLGKQRLETWQILRTLQGITRGWRHHPAVEMWDGHLDALRAYGRAVCLEWRSRGYQDSMLDRFDGPMLFRLPPWFGGEIHATHRSALLEKDPSHYSRFGWTETPGVPYHWPTRVLAASAT